MKKAVLIIELMLILFLPRFTVAQQKLVFHTAAVDSLLLWMQHGCRQDNIQNFIDLPANQIMEQLMKVSVSDAPSFISVLESFNCGNSASGVPYLLYEACENQDEIRQLLSMIGESDLSGKVYGRVTRYFPHSYTIPRQYEVFFSATGWKWGDAMAFDYITKNAKIELAANGTPAMIFNLTLVSSLYGDTREKQLHVLENVMSHELFHAVFSDYINTNWNQWQPESMEDRLLYILINEGIAHYISDREKLLDSYAAGLDLKEKEAAAFSMLSDSLEVIFDTERDQRTREHALQSGTYGRYWNKYICISGMFIAFHIEQHEGESGLIECIEKGPSTFLKKYMALSEGDEHMLPLPDILKKMATAHIISGATGY